LSNVASLERVVISSTGGEPMETALDSPKSIKNQRLENLLLMNGKIIKSISQQHYIGKDQI
jgi:hypothetical protein